jgi:hypothetical protein
MFIRHIDVLGLEPQLFLNSHSRHKTLFGGLLTTFSISVCFALSIYFFLVMVQRKEMNLVYNPKNIVRPSVNFTGYPFLFDVQNANGGQIPTARTYNLYTALMNYYTDPQGQVIVNRTDIQLEKCTNTSFGDYAKYVTFSTGWCVPKNLNLVLDGVFGDSSNGGFSFWILFINPCVNSTANSNSCYDSATITSKLANAWFAFSYMDVNLDHDNIQDPVIPIWKMESLPVTSTMYYKYFYYFKQGIYNTDYGFIFEGKSNVTYYQKDNFVLYNYPPSAGAATISNQTAMTTLIITPSSIYDQYSRSYTKLQTTLANIGGAVKSLMLVSRTLIYIFTLNTFLSDILGRIYKERKCLDGDKNLNESIQALHNKSSQYITPNMSVKVPTLSPRSKGTTSNIIENIQKYHKEKKYLII